MQASSGLCVPLCHSISVAVVAGCGGTLTLLMTCSAVAGAIHSLECMPASIQIAGLERSLAPICCRAQSFNTTIHVGHVKTQCLS